MGNSNNIVIIIQRRPAFDMDWHTLLPVGHRNNLLIFIGGPKSIKKLTELDRKFFAAVYVSHL